MSQSSHIIKKFVLDLSYSDQRLARKSQDELAEQIQAEIVKKLSKLFDEVVDENQVIEIDKLEVDLGDFGKEEVRNRWPEKLLEEVGKAIKKEQSDQSISNQTRSKKGLSSDVLLRFLKNGRLDWRQPVLTHKNIKSQLIETIEDRKSLSPMVDAMLQDKRVTQRFLNHVTIEIAQNFLASFTQLKAENQWSPVAAGGVKELLVLVGSSKQKYLDTYQRLLKTIDVSPHLFRLPNSWLLEVLKDISFVLDYNEVTSVLKKTSPETAESSLWTDFVTEIATLDKIKIKPLQIRTIIDHVKRNGVNNDEIMIALEKSGVLKPSRSVRTNNAGDREKAKESDSIKNHDTNRKGQSDYKEHLSPLDRAESLLDESQAQDESSQNEPHWNQELDPSDLLYVENAGLVLLWPYFSTLFKRLNLLEGKSFVSEDAQQRAVMLLQYLVTGKTECEEHELLLNKVLCGVPLGAPVPVSVKLSEQEIDELDGLLTSVISNWAALGKASIEALRETFLVREGAIEVRGEHEWVLKVERKGVDILVDRIDWGFSMVIVSWTDNKLYVEW